MKLEHLTVSYGDKTVFKDMNLSLPKGKIISLIGPNGCGKTTLLKTVVGLLEPRQGNITLEGQALANLSRRELAKRISYLPQSRPVADMTVESLVLHGRFPYLGWSRKPGVKDRELAGQAMETAGVLPYRHRKIASLSGGERQRAYLAMNLAQNAEWMLLDEPTTYLDIHHQLELLRLIQELPGQGKTVVMVLHDLAQACRVSDHIVVLSEGKIMFEGKPEALLSSGLVEQVFHVRPVWAEQNGERFCQFTSLIP